MNRYEIVVVEIVRPSTAEKYLLALPPVIWKAAIMSTVATTPESRFIAIGVPNRAENLPRIRGPPPSSEATASVPVRAHDPGRPGAGQGEDEHDGHDPAQDQPGSGEGRVPLAETCPP